MGVTSLPPGIRRSRDRPTAYVIDHASSINEPLSKVVRVFPVEFALLITARQHTTDGGFLFTVNDMLGCVQFGACVITPKTTKDHKRPQKTPKDQKKTTKIPKSQENASICQQECIK